MRISLVVIGLLSAIVAPAFAEDYPVAEGYQVMQRIRLRDGSFLNIYKDGKAAMESGRGQPISMKPGQSMLTVDGRTLTMVGNETYRLESKGPSSKPVGSQ